MRRFPSLRFARTWAGLFAPLLLAFVLVTNLMTPFAPLASYSAEVAGLDDTNSVVICTDDGWKRISFVELGIESPADLDGKYCAEFCSLCIVSLAGHALLVPEYAFTLHATAQATRMSVRMSETILATSDPTLNRPRAPPAFS